MVLRHFGELLSERAFACANDPAGRGGAVRLGDCGRMIERPAEGRDLAAEVRIERKLLRDDERRDEHDARSAIGGEAAGEIERVLALRQAEERHDDAAVADGGSAPGEPARLPVECAQIRPAHHSS
jgi:hypothetical protein